MDDVAAKQYDLSRLNILVVDDCDFSRQSMVAILETLNAGKIFEVKNGKEAIEYITSSVFQSAVRGQTNIDIVITDWHMPIAGGDELTTWIRRDKDSPNRAMPIIALSGILDNKTIEEARNLGVTEILAKPLSVSKLAQWFVAIIERPRPFIWDGTYFGPDRRTKDAQRASEKPVETLFTIKNPDFLDTSEKTYLFNLNNALRAKYDLKGSEKGNISPHLVAQAETVIDDREAEYLQWVGENIETLKSFHQHLIDVPEQSADSALKIRRIGGHLAGQGKTYGYNLATKLGHSLVDLSFSQAIHESKGHKILRAHIDSLRVIVREKIRGDGGDVGEAILEALAIKMK